MRWCLLSGSLLICGTLGAACADEPADPADAGPTDPTPPEEDEPDPPAPGGDPLAAHCEDFIGAPRVEEVADGLFVAIGYDLANTILLATDEGNLVIDTSSSPVRAEEVKAALQAVAPGPTRAIVYTHSHADHIGGASVWAEPGTEIWATDAFMPHLVKQYGVFRRAEVRRATLQFGQRLSDDELPCSALGKRIDVEAALETGVRSPTKTFTGEVEIEIGGVAVLLVEAHGETHDQLFVYVPSLGALMPGDNYYAAFPNLYTIRGTSPRPVDRWVESLDAMRALDPDVLVPSHTTPVQGRDEVRAVLTDYRDAIAWVHDEVVRGANQLEPIDTLVARIRLPEHLVDQPFLQELYGQVSWSARAIYTNSLGWFDGRADRLYPPADIASREVELMGGPQVVLSKAVEARESGDVRWAVHLLGKLRHSGDGEPDLVATELAAATAALGAATANSNGRAYLLETALDLKEGPSEPTQPPTLQDAFVDALPIGFFFAALPSRVKPAVTGDVHESVRFEFSDSGDVFVVTVRRGVAEIVEGDALPGTPAPIAVVTTTTQTWRRLALGMKDQLEAVVDGSLEATDLIGFAAFMDHFDRGL